MLNRSGGKAYLFRSLSCLEFIELLWLAPRGDTPLLEGHLEPCAPLEGYSKSEYVALIGRGTTRLMIQQFDLEFTEQQGIGPSIQFYVSPQSILTIWSTVAWADSGIFQDFPTDGMLPEDRWKIHLGRRVTLEPDDPDGSIFIEDLLEEIIKHNRHGWETVKEDGVWVTRPYVACKTASVPNIIPSISSSGDQNTRLEDAPALALGGTVRSLTAENDLKKLVGDEYEIDEWAEEDPDTFDCFHPFLTMPLYDDRNECEVDELETNWGSDFDEGGILGRDSD